ncbi:helix-turn-helix transcriptional regulator [Gracilibacillus xinjiangensis]|uniref:Helix-turn-helix transcriptional regulator n=1 Tax=Gracilibacillus xinjiangensis TaxID=1193282 RepID=A0ABV8WTU0_9BACI
MNMELAFLMRKMRRLKDIKQEQMAKLMGMSRQAISRIENGETQIKAVDLFRWVQTTHGQDMLINFMMSADLVSTAVTSIPGVTMLITNLSLLAA